MDVFHNRRIPGGKRVALSRYSHSPGRHLFPLGRNAEGEHPGPFIHLFHGLYDDDYMFLYY